MLTFLTAKDSGSHTGDTVAQTEDEKLIDLKKKEKERLYTGLLFLAVSAKSYQNIEYTFYNRTFYTK